MRSDLHDPDAIDAAGLSASIPLMASERGVPLPSSWTDVARFVDREIHPTPLLGPPPVSRQTSSHCRQPPASEEIRSHHAAEPLDPPRALELWKRAAVASGVAIKHVEPLGPLESAARLLDTQERLIDAFGVGRVTVLATGELALPFRCLLAPRNAFDYLAMERSGGNWAAAPGQRLLGDAVRDRRVAGKRGARKALLGSSVSHSRSPRIHALPFDRIDVPPDANVTALLAALLPHYDGLAVTSPFKKEVAHAIGVGAAAVNTLVRRKGQTGWHWTGFNTDVAGAQAALRHFDSGPVQVLGDGGATSAIRAACEESGRGVTILRRDAWPRPSALGPGPLDLAGAPDPTGGPVVSRLPGGDHRLW